MEEVECYFGKFEDLNAYQCLITAGNSFGLMDAGMDLAVVKFFGTQLMEDIQEKILREYLGEQLVGTAFIAETHNIMHPYVVHAPTMRAPMNINLTDNIYNAMWASLIAVHQHNLTNQRKIEHLVTTSLGTGTGGVQALESSLQMKLAIQNFLTPAEYINPSMAQHRHETVHYGGNWGTNNPRQDFQL